MSDIKYMEKPDWVSWDSIKECLVSGHEYNRKRGIYMAIIQRPEERLAKAERENKMLKKENADLKAKIEYVAILDYPEMLEEEEEEQND